ncbi:hypothetical protein CP556_21370 [Natrinema sp. CBA1119]|nr:hypothetical protein CP556_21370 [Natrinema sp. CBA1119]
MNTITSQLLLDMHHDWQWRLLERGSVFMKKAIQTHIYWRKIQSRSSADRGRSSIESHWKRAVLFL